MDTFGAMFVGGVLGAFGASLLRELVAWYRRARRPCPGCHLKWRHRPGCPWR